ILHTREHVPGKVDTRRDTWYVYFHKWAYAKAVAPLWDTEIKSHYKQARLFGARRITLLYLHYNVPLVLESEQLTDDAESALTTYFKTLRDAFEDATANTTGADRAKAAAAWWSTHLGNDAAAKAAMTAVGTAANPISA